MLCLRTYIVCVSTSSGTDSSRLSVQSFGQKSSISYFCIELIRDSYSSYSVSYYNLNCNSGTNFSRIFFVYFDLAVGVSWGQNLRCKGNDALNLLFYELFSFLIIKRRVSFPSIVLYSYLRFYVVLGRVSFIYN